MPPLDGAWRGAKNRAASDLEGIRGDMSVVAVATFPLAGALTTSLAEGDRSSGLETTA